MPTKLGGIVSPPQVLLVEKPVTQQATSTRAYIWQWVGAWCGSLSIRQTGEEINVQCVTKLQPQQAECLREGVYKTNGVNTGLGAFMSTANNTKKVELALGAAG